MAYRTFDHKADIGIIGIGSTKEQAFEEAAKGMFDVMTDVRKVRHTREFHLTVTAQREEELFVEFLNALIAQSSLKDMFFSTFKVKIKGDYLDCLYAGESISEKHEFRTEVKAATYSQVKVEKKNDKFHAQCILDV